VDPPELVARATSDLAVRPRPYPAPLPVELATWRVYLLDAGHSILCLLREHLPAALEDPAGYLIPVPVRTVRRGYAIERGFVVVDLAYDADIGLRVPEGDEEF